MPSPDSNGVTLALRARKKRRAGQVTPLRLLKLIGGIALVLAVIQSQRWLLDYGEKGASKSSDTPLIEATGLQTFTVRENGQIAWTFSADRIVVSGDKLYATATGLRKGILYRDGKPFLQLQAQQVRLNQQTRDLDATGTVSAQGPDGLVVSTDHALWTHRLKRLDCPNNVRATLRGLTFTTRRVFYDANQGKLHCPQPYKVEGSGVTLSGAGAVADTKTQIIRSRGTGEIVIRPSTFSKRLPSKRLP